MRKTVTILYCDLCEGQQTAEGSETVGLNGKAVALDLCTRHRAELIDPLRELINKGEATDWPNRTRSDGRKLPPPIKFPAGETREERKAIKTWLVENGYRSSNRGLLGEDQRAIFAAHHNGHTATPTIHGVDTDEHQQLNGHTATNSRKRSAKVVA